LVMAHCTFSNGHSRLPKDNAANELRNLRNGSDGTLGINTAPALKLAPIPASEGTAFFQVASPDAALALLALARAHVGEGLSAFELIHRQSFDFLTEKLPDLRHPFAETPDWAVLMELGLPRGLAPQRAFEDMYAEASAAALSSDAVIAQSEQQRADFWALRESIPEANRRIGSVSSHDISLPLGALADFIRAASPALAAIGDFRVNCFGHVGDGNLHYNVFPQPGRSRADHENERPEIKRVVHDLVHGFGGSVAAEHGVGRLKVEDLERYGDPALLSMMRSVKFALDPKGILNPGVMLR
ncbi:MAG: FAD-binding oxidoreductase, partial [Pseudomonadota bacterium]